jgi:hypothetical protein
MAGWLARSAGLAGSAGSAGSAQLSLPSTRQHASTRQHTPATSQHHPSSPLGFLNRRRPTQSDKRLNARGEANVKIIIRQAQRIMLDMRMEKDRWQEATDYASHTRNLTCMVRDASPTGHGIRPIEAVSHNKISRDVCEQRLEAAQPPGTLCLVHNVTCAAAIRSTGTNHSHTHRLNVVGLTTF